MTADPKTTSAATETEYLYSIRVADEAGEDCAICEAPTGAGPVGYRDDDTVCDMCLLDACTDLGLVLALIAVTRAFGAVPWRDRESGQEGLAQLGAFARVFEHILAKKSERRGMDLPERDEALRDL